jgi:3-oxoacyl-[acyl-carrier-protein] synthase-3
VAATEAEPATRSHLATLTGVQIMAVSGYAPPEIVRNEDLAPMGFDPEWIRQRTGILARRRAPADWATSDLGYEAAKVCLDRAGVSPHDLDMLIVATMTPDSATPSTACRLQRRLGVRVPAMDLSAACSGFVYALVTGMQFVKTGCHRRVLVVGSDLMSRIVNPADKKTYPLFGDGAGAVLLGPGDADQGLLSYTLGADGNGADMLYVPAGGTREVLTAEGVAEGRQFLQMDGRSVFKWAVRLVADAVKDVLQHAKVSLHEIDLFVLHQANRRILDAAAESLGIAPEKVLINVDRYGNTSAGSIPLALDEAYSTGRIRRGDKILLCGFGAGLAWGAAVLQW